MGAYARGDAASFDLLFVRYRRPLFTFLLHHTGDRDTAEDLFQEAFVRMIRARKSYVPRGSFESWLFTIARHSMIDHRRRSDVRRPAGPDVQVRETSGSPDGGTPTERIASRDPHDDPLLRTELGALRDRIHTALRRLPDVQREVFLLRERAGMDFAGIARVTGSRVATAKSRMRYALANLRRFLSEDPAIVREVAHE